MKTTNNYQSSSYREEILLSMCIIYTRASTMLLHSSFRNNTNPLFSYFIDTNQDLNEDEMYERLNL